MGIFDDLIPQQQRAPVQSSGKVWGDAEAEAAGLYETRGGSPASPPAAPSAKPSLSFDDLIPKQTASAAVAERFPEQQPQNPAMQAQAQQLARSVTTGAPTSRGTKIGIDFANSQAAAGQRTTPNIEAQYKNLVSDQAFESETGEVLYRDPATGRVLPTDKNKHVALTDPADGRVKIFARTESTDEGALSSAGRLTMSGMGAGAATARPAIGVTAALRPGQEVTMAADRLGVQVPRAVTTDSTAVQRVAATTRNIPLAGDPLVRGAERTLTQIGTKANEVAQGYGGGTVVGAGDAAKGAISQYITGKTAEAAGKLYDAVDDLVSPGVTRELSATRGAVATIAAERGAAGLPPGKAIETVLDAVQRPGGLTYEGTKTLRAAIGEDLKRGILPEGMSQGDMKRLYGALTNDLKAVVGDAGGPKASAAFERANRYYNLASERNSQLAKIVGANADAPAEQVFERLVAKASSSARGDIEALAKARKAIGAEGWNEFASGVVAKLGRDVEGNFSPQRFLTDYGKLSESGKAILFKSGGNAGLAQSLDDIAKVSSRFKELQKFANPSGTSQSVMGGGIAAGMFADPLTTIGTVVGGRVLATALARPSTAASVAKWSRTYEQLAKNPTTPRLAMLEMASRNLVTNLKDVGANISVKDFLKALQGPVAGRAEEEQPQPVRVGN